jgi:thiol:disulfide interchange protein DsbC
MKFPPLFLFIGSLLVSFSAAAEGKNEISGADQLRLALAKSMPAVKTTKITQSPIDGLYEVIVGSQVVYMSVDGRYMIEGDLYDFRTQTNVSEKAKSVIRLAAVNDFGADKMLVYKPDNVKDVVTVVTDIDCPYCRRLHSEIPEYLKNNIEVRYIFMPLKGASDMKKTISVWCADNPQKALDIAKSGGVVEEKTCDNPIEQQKQLARELGVRGTPAILLEDGTLVPGYVPIAKLVAQIRK